MIKKFTRNELLIISKKKKKLTGKFEKLLHFHQNSRQTFTKTFPIFDIKLPTSSRNKNWCSQGVVQEFPSSFNSGVSVNHQIVLKSSSRVPNIPPESNIISKSRRATNPTTPCRKIATFPSQTPKNHKISQEKTNKKSAKKKKHFLIIEFFASN